MLVHLSDLHIAAPPIPSQQADRAVETMTALTEPESTWERRKPTWWPTFRGHDVNACWGLANWWGKFRRAHRDARIVVTGDVTRTGGHLEFGSAHTYLRGQWRVPGRAGGLVGLDAGASTLWSVPGNHDLWGGRILGLPKIAQARAGVAGNHFWALPWISQVVLPEQSDLALQLIGLDSQCDLSRLSLVQAIARGAVSREHLEEASEAIKHHTALMRWPAIKGFLRIVLIHHPPSSIARVGGRQMLLDWLAEQQVHMVLCGHTHLHSAPDPAATAIHPERARPLIFTAGTTTQRGTDSRLPGREPNHFFVYRFQHSGSSLLVRLDVDDYWYTGARWRGPEGGPSRQYFLTALKPGD